MLNELSSLSKEDKISLSEALNELSERESNRENEENICSGNRSNLAEEIDHSNINR